MKLLFNLLKKHIAWIGIVLFIFILLKIDRQKLLAILTTSELRYIVIVALLAPVIMFIMALRWHYILRTLGIQYKLINAFISLIKGALFGEVTPGRLGEFLRAKYVTEQTDASAGKVLFSIVIDRIYDILILVGLAGVSCFVLTVIYTIDIPLSLIIVFSVGIIVLIALLMNERFVRRTLLPVFNFLVPAKYQENTHFHFSEFYDGLKSIQVNTHIVCAILSSMIWMLKLLVLYFLSRALKTEIPFWFVLSIGSIAVIVSLLPISVSGFGTRDAVFIFFLSFYNISAEFAVALSFLFLVFGFWSVAISAAIVYMNELATLLLRKI